jgi:DNA-binding MarR family transcriptional regulator
MNDMPPATPAPDTASASLLFSLLQAAQTYHGRMEEELKAIGLSRTLYETVSQLVRASRALTLRELAEGQHCAPSNITQKMDRLEREGLVRRVDDSTDRRIVRAEITPLGEARAAAGDRVMERLQAEFEAALPAADRAVLARALAALR